MQRNDRNCTDVRVSAMVLRAAPPAGEGVMTRVLVIEHNLSVRSVIKRLLEAEGLITVSVDSSEPALAALRASPFDTVIIDAILRDGEGLETIRAIRKMAPDVPVIMLFGHHHQN